jgi:hypothetical protein
MQGQNNKSKTQTILEILRKMPKDVVARIPIIKEPCEPIPKRDRKRREV